MKKKTHYCFDALYTKFYCVTNTTGVTAFPEALDKMSHNVSPSWEFVVLPISIINTSSSKVSLMVLPGSSPTEPHQWSKAYSYSFCGHYKLIISSCSQTHFYLSSLCFTNCVAWGWKGDNFSREAIAKNIKWKNHFSLFQFCYLRGFLLFYFFSC